MVFVSYIAENDFVVVEIDIVFVNYMAEIDFVVVNYIVDFVVYYMDKFDFAD